MGLNFAFVIYGTFLTWASGEGNLWCACRVFL